MYVIYQLNILPLLQPINSLPIPLRMVGALDVSSSDGTSNSDTEKLQAEAGEPLF